LEMVTNSGQYVNYSILVLTVMVLFCFSASTATMVAESNNDLDYQLINGDTQVDIFGYHNSRGSVQIIEQGEV